MRILLIEDDQEAAAYVARGLREAGHVCDVVHDGSDGLFQATREAYDVLVVDRMCRGSTGSGSCARCARPGAPRRRCS